MKFSQFQKDIFKFCKSGKGNAIVQAVAGSGKTTTAVKAIEYCEGEIVYLAFNKSIATELQERDVNGQTFHSLCLKALFKIKKYVVDSDKLFKICKQHLTFEDNKMYGNGVRKLVSLGKQSAIGIECGNEEFERLFLEHDMSLDSVNGNLERLLELTATIFKLSTRPDDTKIDFDDMLYYAVLHKVKFSKFDFIFVDEAQDTNLIQRMILRQMMRKGTRLIAIGDKYQSIYKFRGADSNAMELIQSEFKCKELPLSVSYRCAKSIVEYAQRYSPLIQSADNAPQGEVVDFKNWNVRDFGRKDLVICRTTAPIINLAYKCLSASIPVQVKGRDIGKGLESLIKRCTVYDNSIDGLINGLRIHTDKELDRAQRLGQESKMVSIMDKHDTVMELVKNLPLNKQTVEDLLEVIETLFKEKNNAVTFSTIHKAKGLEADTVWWLNYEQCPPPWAKKPEDVKQEINICYVATTRAKTRLNLISDGQAPRSTFQFFKHSTIDSNGNTYTNSALGSGESLHVNGVLEYMDDGNGNTYDINDEGEDF